MKLNVKNVHIRTREMHNIYELLGHYDLDSMQIAIFKQLYIYISPLIPSIYYKVATFSDGKYTLTIRKDRDGMYDVKYISVVVCFVAFLANDIYGYLSWQKMKKRQATSLEL